jgi:hypothetical protein
MPRNIHVKDYDTIAVSSSAGTLVSLGGLSATPDGARSFQGTVETSSIRMRGDGTAPTTSEGQLLSVGSKVTVDESEFSSTQFIRDGTVDGVLKGHYYNVEAIVLLGGH